MFSAGNLLDVLQELYPPEFALQDDNFGLQIGSLSAQIRSVLISLDLDEKSIALAKKKSCDAIVTHHPIWRRGPKMLNEDDASVSRALSAARAGLVVINAHTNADFAPGGICDALSELLSLNTVISLYEEKRVPIGRIGRVRPTKWKNYRARLNRLFGKNVRASGTVPDIVEIVALCSGSGSDLLEKAYESGADIFVTGDVKYHTARDAETLGKKRIGKEGRGFLLVDAGHYETEKIFVDITAKGLKRTASKLRIEKSIVKSPFILL